MKTREQINAANLHASYMRGWVDGAKVTAMRAEFDSHANVGMRQAYHVGYHDGRSARGLASTAASSRYGHWPEILRLQGVDGLTGGGE